MVNELIPNELIESKIIIIRDNKIILDRDLATLYEVETKYLNRQVKRNLERFPKEFMFQVTKEEKNELVTNWHRFNSLKHTRMLPNAFTEQGVAMLSSVLRSKRAIAVNIQIMKTFTKLRQLVSSNKEMALKLDLVIKTLNEHDGQIKSIYEVLEQLLEAPVDEKRKIGYL